MATLKKYDLSGKETGEVQIEDSTLTEDVNSQLLKDYLVALRNNQRQWSANTKGRSEVSCTNKKPHPQKGTGRARQGTYAAPHFRGGGVVFGPKPKFDQNVRMNKKERRAVIQYLLSEMIRGGHLCVLDSAQMESPKTKTVAGFFEAIGAADKKVLVLAETRSAEQKAVYHPFTKSMRNLKKKHFKSIAAVNGHDLANGDCVVLTENALEELKTVLER